MYRRSINGTDIIRKILSVLVITALLIGVLPSFDTAVSADVAIGSMNALDALGIDSTLLPDDFDPDSLDNPYGRNLVTVNPVYELYITDTTTNYTKLFGHETSLNHTVDQFRDTGADPESPENPAVSAVISISDSGNFINTSGFDVSEKSKTGQIVTVAAGDLDKNGGLYLYFSDPVTGANSDVRTLVDTTGTIGNSGGEMEENFVESPFLMRNFMQVATGDFDNNGIDEIAVYVAEQNNSRVEIYRLKVTDGMSADSYLVQSNWEKAWTYFFNESPYVSNMVSITAGDFTRDGTDDLALTWGYYYGPEENSGCKAVVLYGEAGSMLQKSKTFNLSYNTADIVRAAFTFGDLDGDDVDDLILGGQLATDIAAGNLYTRFLAKYVYDGETDTFKQDFGENLDLFKRENGQWEYPAMIRNYPLKLYTLPAMVTNIATVNMKGFGESSYVYMDSLLIEKKESGLDIIEAFDYEFHFNRQIYNETSDFITTSSLQHYVEYGITSADFLGGGEDTIRIMQSHVLIQETSPYYWSVDPEYDLFTPDIADGITDLVVLWGVDDPSDPGNVQFEYRRKMLDNNGSNYPEGFKYSFCKANTDNDTSLIEYTGYHYLQYSDPEILSVIASPPYFSDLDNDAFDSFYMVSETSYANTTGSGTEETEFISLSAGAYFGVERDLEVFKIGFEASYQRNQTWEAKSRERLEQTVSYATSAGEDAVALYSIPIETYLYKIYAPVTDGDGNVIKYDSQFMKMDFPHRATVKVLSLDTYEKIAADYVELPSVSGTALTHDVGVPGTYPSGSSGYMNVIAYDGDPAEVGFGNGSIAQEINMTSETENSITVSNEVGLKTGVTLGKSRKVSFGIILGGEHGSGTSVITTTGSSFTGKIYNMPVEAEAYDYGMAWKLFCYEYSIEGRRFPVVNYIVTDVSAPPRLPEDFQQDTEGTTDDQVKLTWSYDEPAAGFQLYRYYEFPDGSGSYELAFIPADAYNGSRKTYEFVDTGLDPYTEYDYQIQVIGTRLPSESILSEVFTAKTKTDVGYPDISLIGLSEGSIDVYPDMEYTVTAIVNNLADYAQTPKFQWQKMEDQGWTDLSGETSSNFVIRSAGLLDTGQYRCRINVIDSGYYISAYSDVFSVNYYKRTPMIAEGSFTVEDEGIEDNTPTLTVRLKSAHTDHLLPPTGRVYFFISGADYAGSIYADLVDQGDGEAEARITFSEDNPLPDGAYEINTYYAGDRVFKSFISDISVPYLSGSGNGKFISMDSYYFYGDPLAPTLKNVIKTDGVTVDEADESVVNYKVIYEESIWEWQIIRYERISDFPIIDIPVLGWVEVKVPITIQEFTSDDANTRTEKAGKFTLYAYLEGSAEPVANKEFQVLPKRIRIIAQDQDMEVDPGLTHPDDSILSVVYGSLVNGDTMSDLGLVVKAYNTAGTEVTIDGSTSAGSYKIIGAPGETIGSKYSNYQIVYGAGTYILTGLKYSVVGSAREVNGKVVAEVELLSPEGNIPWTTQYSGSTPLVFLASLNNGYSIKDWYISYGGGDPVRQYVTNSTLSLVMPDQDIAVEVEIIVTQSTLSYVTSTGGDVSCTSDTVFSSGTVAAEGAEFTFLADPHEGYHFKEWQLTEIGKNVTYPEGELDSEGNSTCSITMGSNHTVLYAIFERDSYVLTLGDNLIAGYLWDDDGDITTELVTKYVNSGTEITGDTEVTVMPAIGYVIRDGAVWYQDGFPVTEGTIAADNQSYTFNLVRDTYINSSTLNERYSVDLELTGPGIGENNVVVYINDAPSTSLDSIAGGSRVEFVAEAGYGYEFNEWIVTGSAFSESGNRLVIDAISGDTQVQAVFKDSDGYGVLVLFGDRGTMSYTKNDGPVTPVTTGDTISVFSGDTVILTVEPEVNFMVENWKIFDGFDSTAYTLYQSHEKTWTLEDITDDKKVLVNFGAKTYSTVTYSDNIVSAISDGVPFESGNTSIGNGSTLVFETEPGPGEMVYYWKVNDQIMNTLYGSPHVDNVFEITSLAGDSHVEVVFRDIVTYSVNLTENHVTASIEYIPDTPEAREWATAVITVIADEGYHVVPDECELIGYEGPVNGFDSFIRLDDNDGVFFVNAIYQNLEAILTAVEIYSLTVTAPTGGEITISKDTALAGEEITLTAVPDDRMRFTGWSVVDETTNEVPVTDASSMTTTMTMPSSDITITASFEQTSSGGGGSGGGGGGGFIFFMPPGKVYPADFIYEKDEIQVPLTDRKTTLSIQASQDLVAMGESKTIIIEGNGVKIIIPSGLLKEGFDINEMIPDVSGITPGPHMVVAYTDSEGVIHIVQWSTVEEGLVTFIAEGLGTYSVILNEITFLDTIDHWGEEWISFTAAREMFNGTGDGKFSPELPMNRAMIVTVLHRLVGLHEADPCGLSDVLEDQWYTKAVDWAVSSGISTGNDHGEFGVEVNITREELAVMLYRYSEYIGEERLDGGSLEGFTDAGDISEYAISAMGWATNVGIIKGRTVTELDPQGQATRAEVTTMLARYIKWILSK